MRPVLLLACLLLMLPGCSGQGIGGDDPKLEIVRFDRQLYAWLTGEGGADEASAIDEDFLSLLGEKVLHIGAPDSTGFDSRLRGYFSEPTLMALYRDQQREYADIGDVEKELSRGMERLLEAFPQLAPPTVYMHVSGLEQNVIVSDNALSLSADKYLGEDYELYPQFFYDYQRRQMKRDRVVPDYLLGFLMANFPFGGNPEALLDRMVYEGKLRYLLSVFLPERPARDALAYSEEELDWCLTNEVSIWHSILEKQHLYAPDARTTALYLMDAPYTSTLSDASPGRVGAWVGYRIIVAFMKHNRNTSLPELMEATDSQDILRRSKYRP